MIEKIFDLFLEVGRIVDKNGFFVRKNTHFQEAEELFEEFNSKFEKLLIIAYKKGYTDRQKEKDFDFHSHDWKQIEKDLG